MAEQKDIDIEVLKKEVETLKAEKKDLAKQHDKLWDKHSWTRKRLVSHLYYTKVILWSVLFGIAFCGIFVMGAFSFFKDDTTLRGFGFTLNDEMSLVPYWGLSIICWIVVLVLVGAGWLWKLIMLYENDDFEG